MSLSRGITVIGVLLAMSLPAMAHNSHHGSQNGNRCSRALKYRTPAEVLVDHRAALAAQDWAAVRCNYARNAVVISDQGVDNGRDAIVTSLQGLVGFFGGVQPIVIEEVAVGSMVRVLFTIDLGWLLIPDGIDTYIIKRGKIVQQTAHGLAVIVGPPPGPPPQ